MKGFIYIFSNPSYGETIKIGISKSDPNTRKEELYSTGVPTPFKLEYHALVEDYEKIEKIVHKKLDYCRTSKSREFFKISIEKTVEVIRENAKVYYEEPDYQSHDMSTAKNINTKTSSENKVNFNVASNHKQPQNKFKSYSNDISYGRCISETNYEGELKDGKPHGKGNYTLKDGRVFIGNWKEGNLDGMGTMLCPNETLYSEQWIDGNLIKKFPE